VLDFGGPAVVGPLVQDGPGRPVTLRRHLSMALPLSKIALELTDQITFNLLHPAGRKSIGYTIVTACTPSLAPKFIFLTLLTT